MNEFIILMASLMSIVAISIDAMLPALGTIGHDLGVSDPNQAQYIIAFLFVGMTLGQLLSGPISDAIGRKKILYYGLALYCVGSVVCYLSTSMDAMLIGRLIQGVGVSGPYVSAVAIVRDKFHGREMARIMSLVMVIFILVPTVAPTLGQGILFFGSWRLIFLLYIILSIMLTIWLAFRLEETLAPENRIPFRLGNLWHGLKEVVKCRLTVCYTICMGLSFGAFIGYLNSCQQIFQVQFQTGKLFTVYFGGLALVFGLASLVNSKFVEKLGMRYICSRSTLCITASSALFLGLHYIMPVQFWMFLVYAGLMLFCFGLMFGNLNALAMEKMGHIAGLASAVIGASSSAISMVLGTYIGQQYDNTLIPVTEGFLVLSILSLIIMKMAKEPQQ